MGEEEEEEKVVPMEEQEEEEEDRRRSLEERIQAAELTLEVDNGTPLGGYYGVAGDLLKQANIYRAEKNNIDLYIVLLRFSRLVLETIPSHQDYMAKHHKHRSIFWKTAKNVVHELESLAPDVKCLMDQPNARFNHDGPKMDPRIIPTASIEHQSSNQVLPLIDFERSTTISTVPSSVELDDDLDGVVSPDPSKMDSETTLDGPGVLASPISNSCFEKDLTFNNSKFQGKELLAANCRNPLIGISNPQDCSVMKDIQENCYHFKKEDAVDNKYYCHLQLNDLVTEIASLTHQVLELVCRCHKAEREVLDAARCRKASEQLHAKEMKQRVKTEKVLMDIVLKLESLKNQRDSVLQKLQKAQKEKTNLKSMINEFEDRLRLSEDLICSLQKERDDAIQKARILQRKELLSDTNLASDILKFSYLELELATSNFDSSMKIGEGRFSNVYRGFLCQITVAIKIFNLPGFQDRPDLVQEMDLCTRVRHPHLVSVMGACAEACSLVYEFLPNGSLEDRLNCKDNSSPLSWQARIRIATEVCSALIFLHSCMPQIMIHGNLKPANILLDTNSVSKLCDGRLYHLFQSSFTDTYNGDSTGAFAYVDPEFLATKKPTTESDVYSFGVIILRLLTGRPASGIVKEITEALDKENLEHFLDTSAGDWPYIQARQLAYLGVRCCQRNPGDRPDLANEVWRILEPLKNASSLGSLSTSQLHTDDAPSYFMCPILQEIMREPHVAADGFTYEGEAIRAWFDSGHETSPMTNLMLPHKELLPNHALRSIIQEWLQQHQRQH